MNIRNILVSLAVAVLAAMALVAPGQPAGASPTPSAPASTAPASTAPASPFPAKYWHWNYPHDTGCATVSTHEPPGSGFADVGDPIVWGNCAGALIQQWYTAVHPSGKELFSNLVTTRAQNLCVTLFVKNGQPDGQPAILGLCADAQTQLFALQQASDTHGSTGIAWVDFYLHDAAGNPWAVNLKNGQPVSGNPIQASWGTSGVNPSSDDWGGPVYCTITGGTCSF